jgi:hypothetical protein
MTQSAKQERVEQILGELAELGLMLARDLATEAKAAETPEDKVALTEAFQKTSRAVRLTMALDLKIDRDRARDARDAEREAAALAADKALRESQIMRAAQAAHSHLTQPSPTENQKRRVHQVLNRLLWTEAEGDQEDYEVLLEDLDARLYEAEDAPGFADLPIEPLVRTLAKDMGLSGDFTVTTAERFASALPPPQGGGGGPLAPRDGPKAGPRTGSKRMVEGANPSHRAQYG